MIFLYTLMYFLIVTEFVVALEEQTWPPDLPPSSCANAIRPWENKEGIFKIEIPNSKLGSFDVYCVRDSEGGAAWTIILRRMDGSVNFFRNWTEYEKGFGKVNGEHFIGLKKLYELTNSTENELWVQLMDFQNESRHAKYRKFSISGADEKYTLHVDNYRGDAGDSMKHHNGSKFETANDGNCASYFEGAWWMNNCYLSHLNGKYRQNANSSIGVNWKKFRDESLKYAHMAIRPVKFS